MCSGARDGGEFVFLRVKTKERGAQK